MLFVRWILLMVLTSVLVCCNQKPDAKDAGQAIAVSKSLTHIDDQTEYLANQAERFLRRFEYKDAIEVAEYLLDEYDRNPMIAKIVIEKAKRGLEQRHKEMRLYRKVMEE